MIVLCKVIIVVICKFFFKYKTCIGSRDIITPQQVKTIKIITSLKQVETDLFGYFRFQQII